MASNVDDKEKWKVVMNFMENNPKVMLDMISHPDDQNDAADGIQN